MYDEFSTVDAWKQVRDNEEYSCYFKEYSKKATPNREYLYNVRIFIEANASISSYLFFF